MKKSTKIILIVALVLMMLFAVAYGVYSVYFQFNDQDVKDYIKEEADKYPVEKQAAIFKIVTDGVKDVLADKALVKEVLQLAKDNGTPREFELVHKAVMRAKQFGYIS